MVVELISVGTEILMGNILNSNTQYLAEKCALLGLDQYYQVTVGDNYGRMMETVKRALDRSDIVILTGGLGPTEDDLTKRSLCRGHGNGIGGGSPYPKPAGGVFCRQYL